MSFQNLVRLSQIKKCPCLIMSLSTKCQKMRNKCQLMSHNMMRGYNICDRFTMEHFPRNGIDEQNVLLKTVRLIDK
jgi:hypothetical protein